VPPFTVSHQTAVSPLAAWERVVDWPRHGRYVPFTTVAVTSERKRGVGTVFTARTGGRRVGFDDPMEVVEWQPPVDGSAGHCRLEKRGRVMVGWAELTVEPQGSGARVTWTEDARPAGLPAFTDRVSAAAGRALFGRVLRKLLDD
jgi:Polyketide cyclase / dehydrase and lipid transport